MKAMLRTCFLLASLLSVPAWAAEADEKDIERLTDLVVAAMPFGVVFDGAQARDPNWPLEDKAKNATAGQLACLRGEMSSAGYRRGKRAEVVAYAAAHPANVKRDIELLEAGAADLFGRFVRAGAEQEATGKPADIDAIVASAGAAEAMSLTQLTTPAHYADLRTLIGFGAMFDAADEGAAEMEKRGEDQGMQIGAMLMIKAVRTCDLPLSVFK